MRLPQFPEVLHLFGIALLVLQGSCTEPLPPREDPAQLLAGEARAEYVLTDVVNGFVVNLWARNIYDETLDARAVISGKVEIAWARDPNIKKVGTLTAANIGFVRHYNSLTGQLTLDPGDSISLFYVWKIMDSTENALRRLIFGLVGDPHCYRDPPPGCDTCQRIYLRNIAPEETFIVSSEAVFYQNTAPVKFGPILFTFCLASIKIDDRICTPSRKYPPCGP